MAHVRIRVRDLRRVFREAAGLAVAGQPCANCGSTETVAVCFGYTPNDGLKCKQCGRDTIFDERTGEPYTMPTWPRRLPDPLDDPWDEEDEDRRNECTLREAAGFEPVDDWADELMGDGDMSWLDEPATPSHVPGRQVGLGLPDLDFDIEDTEDPAEDERIEREDPHVFGEADCMCDEGEDHECGLEEDDDHRYANDDYRCRACGGSGIIYTAGKAGSHKRCKACGGSGEEPSKPVKKRRQNESDLDEADDWLVPGARLVHKGLERSGGDVHHRGVEVEVLNSDDSRVDDQREHDERFWNESYLGRIAYAVVTKSSKHTNWKVGDIVHVDPEDRDDWSLVGTLGERGIHEAAPKGKGWERLTKDLKKATNVDNPFALAHSMKNKGMRPREQKR